MYKLAREILKELREIKKMLQVIASNKEQYKSKSYRESLNVNSTDETEIPDLEKLNGYYIEHLKSTFN